MNAGERKMKTGKKDGNDRWKRIKKEIMKE